VWIGILIVVTFGAVLISYSTANNPWEFSYSKIYISAANNLIDGCGFGLIYIHYGDNPDDQAQKLFRENKAALILFQSIFYQFQRFDYSHAQDRLNAFVQRLHVYGEYPDGTIYFYNSP
jgi:hypothetical protein